MQLAKYRSGDDARVGRLEADQLIPLDLSSSDCSSLSDILESSDPAAVVMDIEQPDQAIAIDQVELLAPIDQQEVWAAGVTYKRSQAARMEESEASASCYDLVYRSDRPELFLKATPHRVAGPGKAHRLVGGNMCVRRDLLLRYKMDEDRAAPATNADGTIGVTSSGRGDEEGLYLMLRAAGYEQRAVPDAVVLHEHRYTRRSFFKQAFRGGRSAARLVYKYYLPPRLDLLPFMLSYLTFPLIILHHWLVAVPAFFFAGALAAILYNDLFRKGKTIGETARSFPILLTYYHVRLVGYVIEAVRLRLGMHDLTRRRLRGG